MRKPTLHDAPGQMRGYLFQIERALFNLSQAKGTGKVGIETGDDIVSEYSTDDTLHKKYEQDKSSISSKKPFGNFSVDFWNTLSIWLNAVKDGHVDISNSTFFMVTNVKLPPSRFVLQINDAVNDESADNCVTELRKLGEKHKGKLKLLIRNVLSFSDADLKELLKRISVLDNRCYHDRGGIKKAIRENLHISPKLPFNEIYESLIGWLFDKITDSWDSKIAAWVQVEDLDDKLNDLIAKHERRPFIEKAIRNLPISDSERKDVKQKNFVKQLQNIKASEQMVLTAIDDYLRASWERSRYARETQVTKQDFDDFDDLLNQRWQHIFDTEVALCDGVNEEKTGLKIYSQTVNNYREKLLGVETEQFYTTRGSYQRLSDKLRLGWHPKWNHIVT